jgi:dTDP-4-amino-4,6-dideoxygalactose transaminase
MEALKVPMLDLKIQYATLKEEIMDAIEQLCDSQQFILGNQVTELEQQIADYCHCRHAVGMSSGSDALLAALMALGIGPGDAVITTPYTFFATAGAISRAGARPLFCDIDPATYNLNSESVAGFISRQCSLRENRLLDNQTGTVVKAIIPVHLFGLSVDMDPMLELAEYYHLQIIEDAAQAIGAEYAGGRRVGSMGAIGCFSFFPSKNLGAFGDAGMCTTNDAGLAERLKSLRVHGSQTRYQHQIIGGNFRLDTLQAAVLLVKLRYLDHWIDQRQTTAGYYNAAFSKSEFNGSLCTPQTPAGCRHVYNQYVVRVTRRDQLKEFLAAAGIETEIYYPLPLHDQPCFAHLDYSSQDFPHACATARATLALPVYPELNEVQKKHVVQRIGAFFQQDL